MKQYLEEEEKYDNTLRTLAAAMTNMLSFTEIASERAKLISLQNITTQMLALVEDAAQFIIDYKSKSAFGMLSSSEVEIN